MKPICTNPTLCPQRGTYEPVWYDGCEICDGPYTFGPSTSPICAVCAKAEWDESPAVDADTSVTIRPDDDPYSIPYAIDTTVPFRDQPVYHHGGLYVYRGRRVAEGDWPYRSPEECPLGRRSDCMWIGPEFYQVLVCRGCGLDCT